MLILNVICEDGPTTIIDFNIQGTWDTNEEELKFDNDQAYFEHMMGIHDIEPCWIEGY